MTVCVAGIFERAGIIGASDRMLTAGDVEFEPSTSKVRFFTSSCFAMIAGDALLQTEIETSVRRRVNELIDSAADWLPIETIARVYKDEIDEAVKRLAESRILRPFGLTMDSFLRDQRQLAPEFVRDVQTEILNFQAPGVETIVAGVDKAGPHIFTVANNSFQCHDAVGFACIGSGYWHSTSQMMAFGYTPDHTLSDSLMSVHFSKKRAEIAPGVGTATDMVNIVGLGQASIVGEHVKIELERRYAEEQKRRKKFADATRSKIGAFVENLITATPSVDQAAIPAPSDGTSSDALSTPTE